MMITYLYTYSISETNVLEVTYFNIHKDVFKDQ